MGSSLLSSSSKEINHRSILAAFLALIALGTYLWKNIAEPQFWYDAAGQLFTSLGIEASGTPFSKPGSLIQAIYRNLNGNLDPGGFTLILRYWALISTHGVWLRLLPLSFLVVALYFMYRLARLLVQDIYLSSLLALFPLTSLLIDQWGLSLRAYSMELCGVAFASFLCYQPLFLENKNKLHRAVLTLGFFATSRYSFSFVIISLVVALVLSGPKKIRLRPWVLFMLVLATIPILIPLSHHLDHRPTYIVKYVLAGKTLKEVTEILAVNFLQIETLLQLVFIVLFFWLEKKSPDRERHRTFLIFLVSMDLLFIFASILGLSPWYLTERYSLGLNLVSYVSLIATMSIFTRRASFGKFPTPFFLVLGFALIIIISNFKLDPYSETLGAIRLVTSQSANTKSGYFSPAEYVEAKYLFEYGSLKSSPAYPTRVLTGNKDFLLSGKADHVEFAIVNNIDDWAIRYFTQRPDFEAVRTGYLHMKLFRKLVRTAKPVI